MDVRNLHAITVVAEERSFTAAARRLHTSQSALSQLVRRIEDELGFVVFDRSVSPVGLTPQGQRFIPKASEIDLLYSEALASARASALSSPIAIGATPRMARRLFPALLSASRERAPGPEDPNRIQLIEASSRELAALVAKGVVDVAAITSAAIGEGLSFSPVLSSGFVAAYQSGLIARDNDGAIAPVDLEGQELLLPTAGGVRTHLAPFLDGLAGVSVALESSSTDTLLGLAELGLGVAIVPEVLLTPADRSRREGLRFARLSEATPPLISGTAVRAGLPLSPKLEAAIGLVQHALVTTFSAFASAPEDSEPEPTASAHSPRNRLKS
ncbi:LysR family transcriptional regulator [Nocardioides sp. KC13]|uniref:LysR family transcriptional regulator n=1 Tax=Nocardioides turkmenicus TaxID=2711220 RepID=A0A6M1R345_9ACTN|nr:LysR family transcriptional regulator [Nocardioides sp. KC13]